MLHRAKFFSTCLRELTWFSPLYQATSMIRIIWGGGDRSVFSSYLVDRLGTFADSHSHVYVEF